MFRLVIVWVDNRPISGYSMARMRYEIVFSAEAVEDFRQLSARNRATVRDTIERRLRHTPEEVSKSTVKRLWGIRRPQYRLRVDDHRLYYDVSADTVEILAIVSKAQAAVWLERSGELENETN